MKQETTTTQKIARKLIVEGITAETYTREAANEILNRTVIPVGLKKHLANNELEVLNEINNIESTATYIVLRDGVELKRFENEYTEFTALKYVQRIQSNSFDWAKKYEGYKVQVISNKTGEVTYL